MNSPEMVIKKQNLELGFPHLGVPFLHLYN